MTVVPGHEMLGCHEAVGVLRDLCDLIPVDALAVGVVEEHAEPIAQRPAGRGTRPIEACRSAGSKNLSDALRCGTHHAGPAMSVEVVVVEVAQRSLVTDEETRRTVAEAFVDLREAQSKGADIEEMLIAHTDQCRTNGATGSAQRTRSLRVNAESHGIG